VSAVIVKAGAALELVAILWLYEEVGIIQADQEQRCAAARIRALRKAVPVPM